MAGQKPYSTNILSSARNAVVCTAAYIIDTSKATGGSTLVAGKYIGVTNANGVITVQFPEKFARCEMVNARIVDTGKTGNSMVLTTDYDPSKGQAQFSLLSPSQAAITTGVYKVYISAVFGLG